MCEISSNLCNVKYTDVNLRLGGFRRTLIYTRVLCVFHRGNPCKVAPLRCLLRFPR